MDKVPNTKIIKILKEIEKIGKENNIEEILNIKGYSEEMKRLRDNNYISFPPTIWMNGKNVLGDLYNIQINEKGKLFLKNSKNFGYKLNMYVEDYKRLSIGISLLAIIISLIALFKK